MTRQSTSAQRLPLPVRDGVALAFRRPEVRLIGLGRANPVIDGVFPPGALHADPADRFLIATARRRRVPLATHDRRIIDYGRAARDGSATDQRAARRGMPAHSPASIRMT